MRYILDAFNSRFRRFHLAALSVVMSFIFALSCITAIQAQTVMVKDIFPGPRGSYPFQFTAFGSELIFQAKDSIIGFELFSLNTSDSVKLVNDIFNGSADGFPFQLHNFGSKVMFSASDSAHGHELWSYDGLSAQLVFNINDDTASSWPDEFFQYYGSLYFAATDSLHGRELFKYDGSTVVLAADVYPGLRSSNPSNLTVYNGLLYFSAEDSLHGREFWQFNGSIATLVSDINPGTGSSHPLGFYEYLGKLVFSASNGSLGQELYEFNGTTSSQILDIFSGQQGSYPHYFTNFFGELYFTAMDSLHGSEVFKYDGTMVQLVKDFNPGKKGSYPADYTLFGNELYFSANDGSSGFELCYLDSLDSTYVATDINPGIADAFPVNIVPFNNALYFQALNAESGCELWKYRPCQAGDKPQILGNALQCADSVFSIQLANGDSLRGSSFWALYKDSIGETYLDSSVSGIFELSSDSNATYFIRAEGCDYPGEYDSIKIEVRQPVYDTLQFSICQGDTFNLDTSSYFQSGFYRRTFQSNAGCDSIVVLDLSVLPVTVDTLNTTICDGDSVFFNTGYLKSNGTYSSTFQSSVGCDSIVTLVLEVKPTSFLSLNLSICQGDSLAFGSQILKAGGTYQQVFNNQNSCDSVVDLQLTVLPLSRDTFYDAICYGTTVNFGGMNLGNSGIYHDTLLSSTGCDSILTMVLTVLPILEDTINVSLCEGSTYFFGGSQRNLSGIYKDTSTSSIGCDSIATLVLNLVPPSFDTLYLSICPGDTFIFNSQPLYSPGWHPFLFTSQNGCDSNLAVSLSYYPTFADTIADTICQGSSLTFGSLLLTTTGIYSTTYTNQFGCDSIVTIDLKVLPVYRDTLVAQTCQGIPYVLGSRQLLTSGVHTVNLQSTFGCDSIIVVYLQVKPNFSDTINISICQGDTFQFYNRNLTSTGWYTEVFNSRFNCDSVITLNLNVLPLDTDTFVAVICQGGDYIFGSKTITSAGLYSHIFQSQYGCDSLVYLYLQNRPIYRDTFSLWLCQGDSLSFGNQWLENQGTYSNLFANRFGCDSLVTIHLQLYPTYITLDTAEICEGESFQFGTQNLNTAGTFSASFTTVNGCDSMVVMSLIVHPVYSDTVLTEICAGDSIYFGNQYYSTTGTYSHVFQSQYGCDSSVWLQLNVRPNYFITLFDTICDGQNLVFDNLTLTLSGNYTKNYVTTFGCDSVVTMSLFVLPTFVNNISRSICSGDTFILGSQWLTAAGVYAETFQATNGCDSVVNLALTVNPSFAYSRFDTICAGDSLLFASNYLTSAGIYSHTFTTIKGCDSTVNLQLQVNTSHNNFFSQTICDSDSLVLGNVVYKSSGTYSHTFQTSKGCDSNVVIQLSVNPTYDTSITHVICSGQSFFFGNLALASSGFYTHVFQSALGCDSTVNLHLIVNPVYNHFDTLQMCSGDTLQFGTQFLTISGNFSETFTSIRGCDSTVQLNLTVHPSYRDSMTVKLCAGDTLFLNSNAYTKNGIYTIVNQTGMGCDSITRLDLSFLPEYQHSKTVSICGGSVYSFGSQVLNKPGKYYNLFQSIQGCDSAVSLTLNVTQIDTTVNQNGAELIANFEGGNYQWHKFDGVMIPIAGAINQRFEPSINGTYAVKIYKNFCSIFSESIHITSVGIEQAAEQELKVYPNPNNGKFILDYPPMKRANLVTIELIGLNGVKLLVKHFTAQDKHQIEAEHLPKGIYMMVITIDQEIHHQRLVMY